MFKEPEEKRAQSLERIWRNKMVYLAVFYRKNQLKVKVLYEIEPSIVVKETERQLDWSGNSVSHVGFSERWVRNNGEIVYEDKGNLEGPQ